MQEHKEWLRFAEDDLKVAQTILHSDYIVISAVCYHAQQCAEKALKAYLVFKKIKPRRTHDLSELIYECADHMNEFLTLSADALELSPYAHKTRYPDSNYMMLDVSMAEDAVKRASNILKFVEAIVS